MLSEFLYRERDMVGLLMLVDGEYWFRILGWYNNGVWQRSYSGSGLANPTETQQAKTLDRRMPNIEETYWLGEMFTVKVDPRPVEEETIQKANKKEIRPRKIGWRGRVWGWLRRSFRRIFPFRFMIVRVPI